MESVGAVKNRAEAESFAEVGKLLQRAADRAR
jgi:hypothetical protein